MEVRKLGIEGVIEFTPPVHRDRRGLFCSAFQRQTFARTLGKPLFPVGQVSHNISRRGTLRGIHYTATPPGMAKYVYCPRGRVQDFVVDLRVGSPTFGTSESVTLDEDSNRALFLPVGIGHAFLSTSDDSMVLYVLSGDYVAGNELAVDALDPALGLPVPQGYDHIRSDRDLVAPTLAEAGERGLLPEYAACREAEARLWQ